MLRQGKYNNMTVILLLLLLAITTACSEKITSAGDQGIELQIQSSVGAWMDVTQASTFFLTVTGKGIIKPLTTELFYHDGFLDGEIKVPAGPGRLFVIRAYDADGILIYSGRTIADVIGGEELVLDIEMVPDVPMIKLSPLYTETLQGDLLAMKISVFNLPDIGRIRMEVSNERGENFNFIRYDSLKINPALEVNEPEIWTGEGGEAYIDLESRNVELYSIVDQDGYAEIGTVYYNTHNYEVTLETVIFSPAVLLMQDRGGNTLPIEDIHAETSVAILHAFWSRMVASYNMGLSEIMDNPNFIDDDTDNGLHGMATGTTIINGRFGDARLFDGNSDYITIPDNDLLDLQEGITLAMWVQVDPWSGGTAAPQGPAMNPRMSMVCKRNPEGVINYELAMLDVSQSDEFVELEFRYGNSTTHAYKAVLPHNLLDDWIHIVFSFRFGDPESAIMTAGYSIPSTLEGGWVSGNGFEPPPITSGDLLIGMDNAEISSYFEGGLDELDILDHALSIELIKYRYTFYY